MAHRFDPTSLREYDIRGVVGKTLGAEDAYAIGRGFATHVRRAGGTRVAVGYDGRVSSPMMETALIRGLTTGGVAFLGTAVWVNEGTEHRRAQAGWPWEFGSSVRDRRATITQRMGRTR